jgi:ribosomal protein S6
MSKEKTIEESSRLYELGFHIVGTIDSSKVADVVDQIKNLIKKNHGDIVVEGEVKEIPLAYTMVKHFAGVNTKYNQAFFDWIKFNMSAENVANLKTALDLQEKIIRYLLINAVNDYEHSTNKLADLEKVEKQSEELETETESEAVVEPVVESEVKKEEEPTKEILEKNREIDEAIDEMVK